MVHPGQLTMDSVHGPCPLICGLTLLAVSERQCEQIPCSRGVEAGGLGVKGQPQL